MSGAIVAAAIGSPAPTPASLLAYPNARAARRQATQQTRPGPIGTVEALAGTAPRTEADLGRVEAGVGEPAERMARLEGHLEAGLPDPAAPGRAAP